MTDAAPTDVSSGAAPATSWPAMSVQQAYALITAPGSLLEMETVDIHGVPTRAWKNAPPTLREILAAGRLHGQKVYLVYEDERVTFDAFHRAVAAFAAELRAQGVEKGDRVAIAMRNLPEWPVAFFATVVIGAISVPLNAWWTGPELEYGLTDSGAKIAIVDAERLERLTEHFANCPELKRAYVARAAEEIAHPYIASMETVIGAPDTWAGLPDADVPDAEISTDDDASIFYTSGTTGKPKGAIGSHRNIIHNIFAQAAASARTFLRRGEQPPAPNPDAPQKGSLLAVPFFHATGTMAIMIPSLFGGAKLAMMRKFDPVRAFQLIERERLTGAGGVPTIAWQLIEHPDREKYDLSSLEGVSYGGAPSAPELVRKIGETFKGSQPGQGWGMTETAATVTNNAAEDYRHRPDSAGTAVPVCDLKIVGPDEQELPRGQVGELWARGPNISRGYWGKPEATAATFTNGWVRTGDLARMDDEGFVFIIDRAKDMLIRGGENIYCIEVENALYEHPAVMDAAVVAVPHKTLGEEPGAIVHLTPGASATEEELRAFAAERIAAFKVPVKVVFWPETLPRNANGKILKNELKKVFAGEGAPA